MCGIAGYVGPLEAESVLLVALERLKYRGYDSAGLVVNADGDLTVRKASGRLRELEEVLRQRPLVGHCGIGHTRWATHGAPTTANAHPHLDNDGQVAIVHNGIIENHETLRRELQATGAIFESQTDSEVIAHLLAAQDLRDPIAAVRAVAARLEGSYAFAATFATHPGRLVAIRQGSPLLVGRDDDHVLLASDIPALLPHADAYCQLEDGQIADLQVGSISLSDTAGQTVDLRLQTINLAVDQVTKGDYDSFMAKEIDEQPQVLQSLIDDRCPGGVLRPVDGTVDLATIDHVLFLACGTSWHAALLGKRFLEQIARVHVEVDISSEYRYRNPIAAGGTLVVAISQSGETADTLASVRLARSKFLPVLSLVNVPESTIARESDGVMPLLAGPEIGVASTKAYTGQVLALYLFALQLGRAKGRLSAEECSTRIAAVAELPELVGRTLQETEPAVATAADLFAAARDSVFLGRVGEYPTALEGALKLKEIAYVTAHGYAAGEFKHGPIALVTAKLPVICLCPPGAMHDKMLSNIEEVRARDGRIIAVGAADDDALDAIADHLFPVAVPADELLQPLLTVLPLQRYALLVAQRRGCDVDQPRNLAKSVTVE